ncbi:MAG: ABC transporter ATP-binding protein [Oscillospiraceae bacterium]|jgi:putative ABC transport system ATP-binding protein|nr:ABC transporter ATP-binding protein [Oscillospiraceae bacterium]
MNTLAINNVTYKYGKTTKSVLKNVTANFEKGVLYCIVGKSGAGKSTLLSLISGLDLCTSGAVLYENEDLSTMNRDEYRARNIGVIFQGYNLLTNCSAVENIVLSMNISNCRERCPQRSAKEHVYSLLEKLGIDKETANRKVLKLSGGEQQRVGIARALSNNPEIIIADEPTGNLDGETAKGIMDIFVKLAHEENKCVIIVTHSKDVAAYADQIMRIVNGKLEVQNK